MTLPANRVLRVALILGAFFVVGIYLSLNVTGTFQKLAPRTAVFGLSTEDQLPLAKHINGRVLITGGGGNLGKHVVRRLLSQSTPVTIIDAFFYEEEIQAIRSEYPEVSSLLTVVVGDIRDPHTLRQAMTRDITGVIHLAAVSRVLWCVQNERDCLDVNVRGTQLVLVALAILNHDDSGKRWFVLASSREVYGNGDVNGALVTEDSDKVPVNAYGSSKLKAEQAVEHFLKGSSAKGMRAIILRLSNVYGGVDDHRERLIPSLVTQALSHQTIQIIGGEQNLDMLHIDDCVEAFMLAVERLDQPQWFTFMDGRKSVEAFNVASGSLARSRDLVDNIISLTNSKSPVQYLAGDNRFPNVYRGSIANAAAVLGFKAKINVNDGVLRTVQSHLFKTERYLAEQITSRCAPPASADLQKLDKCSILLGGSVGDELHFLRPDGEYWTAARDALPSDSNMQLSISVRSATSGTAKVVIMGEGEGRMTLPAASTPRQAGLIGLPSLGPTQLTEGDVHEWDMIVDSETGTVRLLLPDSDLQLAPPSLEGGNFSLVHQIEGPGLFRITPICCPVPGPWPFSEDDPLDFMIGYQKSSTSRPFLASPTKALCSRLRRAYAKVKGQQAILAAPQKMAQPVKYSSKPTNWVQDGLPSCSNLCDHPTICVDTGDCQCVLSACKLRDRFPFASFAHSSDISYPSTSNGSSMAVEFDLVANVNKLSWMTVLRPLAARYINTGAKFPRVYVSPLDPDSTRWRAESAQDVDKLTSEKCFSADTSMQHALALLKYPVEDAEMVFVPHFQERAGGDSRLFSQYEWSLNTIPSFNPEKAVIPFTHDWGQCLTFVWSIWEMRASPMSPRPSSMKSMTAWSVMADLNTRCFRPHQDVAIPPRTCVSPTLLQDFKDMANVRPSRDRKMLVSFKGTLWGTWKAFRYQLICRRTGWEDLASKFETSHPLTTLWQTLWEYPSYTSLLNDTIFCPLPGGTTGWATRLVDVLYSGCIPVMFGDSAQYPFFDIIDWGKISVQVAMTEVDRLEEILLTRYTMEDIQRLQVNIMLIRDAFIYPLDGATDEEVVKMMIHERGPLFFALHSTGMRLATKWPTTVEYDRP